MRKFPAIGFAFLSFGISCAVSAAEPALGTREDLVKNIQTFQSTKNCDGVLSLFYTRGMNEKDKKVFVSTIKKFYCSNLPRPITSVAFQEIPLGQIKPPHDFTPLGAIVIDFGPPILHGVPQPKSLSFLYGTHDKKFYLITNRKAVAQ